MAMQIAHEGGKVVTVNGTKYVVLWNGNLAGGRVPDRPVNAKEPGRMDMAGLHPKRKDPHDYEMADFHCGNRADALLRLRGPHGEA